MKILNKFIWSKKEPLNKNDVWFDGSTWRMYTEEAWQSFTLPVDAADKVAKVIENISEVYQEKLNAGEGIVIKGNTISVDDSIKYDDSDVWEIIEILQQNKVEQTQLNDYVSLDRYVSTSQMLIDNVGELDSNKADKAKTEQELNKKLNKTDVATINGKSIINGGNITIKESVSFTPDWNAVEGEEGHIKNRTHYADFVEVDIPEDIASSEVELTIPNIVGAPILVHYAILSTSKYLKISPNDHELHVLSYGPAFKIRRGDGNNIFISGHNAEDHRLYIATHFVALNEIFLPETIARKSEIQNKLTELSAEIKETYGDYEENAEYIKAYTDGEGKFLFGIKTDGSIEWAKGTPKPVKEYIEKAISDGRPALLDIMSVQPSENYDMNHEVVLDAEEKLLSWRDIEGVKHETKMQIENDLRFSKPAMSKFIQSLIASGFTTEIPIDHSKKDSIALPTPRYCAVVNIISPLGLATSKTQDIQCEIEYLDKSGNYFKKKGILNAQGTSSMSYIEKNQSIDMFNDEAREESCEITFDNWVAQDSFHWKCFYIDVFRGVCNMAYKWTEEVIKATDSRNNRVKWNRDDITEYNSTGDFAADFSDSALCHPDGFPFEMYVNGEYYGLYVWNIKKHRKNYSMKKSNYKELLLDGLIDNTTFFNGSINWSEIELRNPKTLITMSGAEYDGENPLELIDSTAAAYSAANKDHVNTAITKAEMQRIANALPLIRAASEEQAKALFESHFDVKALMRYFIISNTLHHYDGFAKNWIWTIYDGIAAPTEYDMDSIFGRDYRGLLVVSNSTTKILGAEEETITGQLIRLYKDELDAMYKDLRDKDILSVKNIMRYVLSWCESATYAAIQRNLEKWTSIPSYRASKNMNDGTQDGGMYDSPYRIEKWLTARIETLDNYFNLR